MSGIGEGTVRLTWTASVLGQGEQEAGEGGKVGDTVMGEAEVVDLVDTIEEKPAEKPAATA